MKRSLLAAVCLAVALSGCASTGASVNAGLQSVQGDVANTAKQVPIVTTDAATVVSDAIQAAASLVSPVTALVAAASTLF